VQNVVEINMKLLCCCLVVWSVCSTDDARKRSVDRCTIFLTITVHSLVFTLFYH